MVAKKIIAISQIIVNFAVVSQPGEISYARIAFGMSFTAR